MNDSTLVRGALVQTQFRLLQLNQPQDGFFRVLSGRLLASVPRLVEL